jgi:CMP/dCMP kinase
MGRPFIVAIDGPSGVGKGTVARALAGALGFRHVDTGAMYRAVAWKALKMSIPLDDEAAVARVAEAIRMDLDGTRLEVDGVDISPEIRTGEIDSAATRVARLPKVREILVHLQRQMASGVGSVFEGRDIGTVVFPEAEVKIYLDASPAERARRRANDPAHASSVKGDLESVANDMRARDKSDMTRSVSPLAVAPDATVIDTTNLPADAVVERVLAVVEERLQRPTDPGCLTDR